MKKSYWLTMADQTEVFLKKWYKPSQKPTAIVQISHGMVEHILRYDDFARFLVENNIFVYGNDHRGHGQTGVKQGLLGYFSTHDGFNKVSEDLHEITMFIKKEYPDVPVFLFGHSMGSFLVRKYIQKYSQQINGVILSGTGFFQSYETSAGKMLASLLPAKKQSHLMNNLAFGSYQKRINNQQTSFDWLTRDQDAVQAYIADPLSGFVPTARFFYDLMDGLKQIHPNKHNQTIRKDLPILFMSGDADPVGDYEKGIWKVANIYKSLDISPVKVMIFEEGRHELLHEINKEEVYQSILKWLHDQSKINEALSLCF